MAKKNKTYSKENVEKAIIYDKIIHKFEKCIFTPLYYIEKCIFL